MKKYSILILVYILIGCKVEENKTNKIELAYQITSQLGEGAFWNYKTDELYWIDIEDKKLYIYNSKTGVNKAIEMPSKIGTVVPSEEEGKAIVALEDGIYMVNTVTEELTLLSDVESDIVENRFNDGKCDPNGNLWVGSMNSLGPSASLYRIKGDGTTKKMLENITISNGIVWTKDKKTMYYIDTPTSKIRAFDFDVQNNTIANERTVIDVAIEDGFPDGMTIDENDMLWVGLWNGNAIGEFDPKTGDLIRKIEVPAHNVTSCAFGGDNLDELYITTASVDMTEEEKTEYPLAGSVFKIKMNVRGVKSTFFKQVNLK